MTDFYTYMYFREDGTPYYVGKGHGRRAWSPNHRVRPPKDPSRIRLRYWASESDALYAENKLILRYGRKDIGTGILRNWTDGGDGLGTGISDETRKRMSEAKKGKPIPHLVGRKHTPEDLVKMREARLRNGDCLTEEGRQKISELTKKRNADTSWHWKISAAKKGVKFSDETKARMSAAAKKRAATPEGKLASSRGGKLGSAARWGKNVE
jgi:hypothetical protein